MNAPYILNLFTSRKAFRGQPGRMVTTNTPKNRSRFLWIYLAACLFLLPLSRSMAIAGDPFSRGSFQTASTPADPSRDDMAEAAGAADRQAPGFPVEIRIYITDFERHELRHRMQENASRFLSELNTAWRDERRPQADRPEISPSLASELERLWDTAPMYVPDDRLFLRAIRGTDGLYEMRDIPLMLLNEEGGEVYEEGILLFTPSGNLAGMRIALPQHQYSRLMREGTDVIDRERRRHIIDFTEEFRTAYNTRNIDFIRKVFSDQALIVVGRMIQETDESSPYEQQVEYLRFSKDEYLERLQHVFRVNRFIDVTFDDVRIHRHPLYEDIYGVNMEQYYTSSTYSDEGFLFLLVDFQVPDAPMIHVRTWQPMRATPEDQIFQLGDIEIIGG